MSDEPVPQQNGVTDTNKAAGNAPAEETKAPAEETAAPVELQPFSWL